MNVMNVNELRQTSTRLGKVKGADTAHDKREKAKDITEACFRPTHENYKDHRQKKRIDLPGTRIQR
jgi:hypothetical protein